MTYKTALCTAALAVCAAAPVLAQTAPAARPATAPAAAAAPRPSSAPTNPGPVIPGVCVLDGEQAINTSAAGRAAAARLTVLRQQVQAELSPEDTALRTEATRIRALPEAQRAAPAQAYQTRGAALQQLAGRRQAELERTEYNALLRINTELSAVVSQIYVQRGCGLMLSKSSIVYANPAMDVTAAAVTALNARMPTITFNRETLPAQPAAGAARP